MTWSPALSTFSRIASPACPCSLEHLNAQRLVLPSLFISENRTNPPPPNLSFTFTPQHMSLLRDTLLNTSGQTPLHERFRALFMLKAVGNEEVVQIVSEGEPCLSLVR